MHNVISLSQVLIGWWYASGLKLTDHLALPENAL